jgi:Spy/CpxP family protein refolding chaperone
MKYLKTIIAVLAVFMLGTIFGMLLSFWMAPKINAPAGPVREFLAQRLNQRLTRELVLASDQQHKIAAIIQDARQQLGELRKETRPRVRQIMEKARIQIRAQLTREQQRIFDQNLQRNRKRLEQWLSR